MHAQDLLQQWHDSPGAGDVVIVCSSRLCAAPVVWGSHPGEWGVGVGMGGRLAWVIHTDHCACNCVFCAWRREEGAASAEAAQELLVQGVASSIGWVRLYVRLWAGQAGTVHANCCKALC